MVDHPRKKPLSFRWHNRTDGGRTYNAANEVVGFTYDDAGNLLNDGSTSYTYDALGRLTQQGGTSYTYNGDDVFVGRGSTTYTQDLLAPLEQVLNDGTTNLMYGHTRITSGTGTWYQHDGLGSVRAVLDGAGAVQTTTSYDPWGVPTAGSTDPFGFTGELQFGEQVHLRARWYHTNLGTFTSRDPFVGFDTLPYSLHPYQYAYSNPVLLTDPSGEAVACGVSALIPGAGLGAAALCFGITVVLPALAGVAGWLIGDVAGRAIRDARETSSPPAADPATVAAPAPRLQPAPRPIPAAPQAPPTGEPRPVEPAVPPLAPPAPPAVPRADPDCDVDADADANVPTNDRDRRDEWTFVGYHGTSSMYVPAILTRINPPGMHASGNQPGEGFYTTPDYTVAMKFAQIAVGVIELDEDEGGEPVVLKVYARNFKRMTRRVVPLTMASVPDHYITDYDYLMSQITGSEPAIQLKFNPHTYGDLRALP